MDARVDGGPVTPRAGFPVEVDALWINGLGVAVDLLARVGGRRRVGRAAEQAVSSFRSAFPRRGAGCRTSSTTPGGRIAECRPNQLLAASLPYGPVKDPDDGRRRSSRRAATSW